MSNNEHTHGYTVLKHQSSSASADPSARKLLMQPPGNALLRRCTNYLNKRETGRSGMEETRVENPIALNKWIIRSDRFLSE
nr:hypothetical protein Iba_chr10cCG8700 [Ipomoea batatas]GMD48352.1 hypothetical protein Iba_chr10fCG5540 [Ipomoea batatas]